MTYPYVFSAPPSPPGRFSGPSVDWFADLGFLEAFECEKIVMEGLDPPSVTKSRPGRVLGSPNVARPRQQSAYKKFVAGSTH